MSKNTNKIPLGRHAAPGAQRDAVHVAIIPMVAGAVLKPGERVGVLDGKLLPGQYAAKTVGIVDPFLRSMVDPGERVYLMLDPNTITGMRHHWEHPAFTTEAPADEIVEAVPGPLQQCAADQDDSKEWLQDFAEQYLNGDYDRLIGHLDTVHKGFKETGGTKAWIRLGWDTPYEDMSSMWYHYGQVRGVNTEKLMEESVTPFTCSC